MTATDTDLAEFCFAVLKHQKDGVDLTLDSDLAVWALQKHAPLFAEHDEERQPQSTESWMIIHQPDTASPTLTAPAGYSSGLNILGR